MADVSRSVAIGSGVRLRSSANPTWYDESSDDDIDASVAVSYSSGISSPQFDFSDKIAWVFTRDIEIRDLVTVGLENLGPARLERDFRCMLLLYSRALRGLVDTSFKSRASRLFRFPFDRLRIARCIVLQTREGLNPRRPDFHQIARLLNTITIDHADLDDSDYSDGFNDYDDVTVVENLVHFLSSGPPFLDLKANLRESVSSTKHNSTIDISSRNRTENLSIWISLRRGCIYIITLGSIFILLSVFVGIYFTVNRSYGYSMGDAFTLAGFVFAVGLGIDGALMGYHYPRCTCWRIGEIEDIPLLSNGVMMDSV